MADTPKQWRMADWHHDHQHQGPNPVSRAWLAEAGGWLYKFTDGNGIQSHVFVPHADTWVDLIKAQTNPAILSALGKMEHHVTKEFDDLTAQVQANSDAVDSAITLINGIADRIDAAKTDPAALTALADELRSKDTALSVAVMANTPVPPAPPPTPVPTPEPPTPAP